MTSIQPAKVATPAVRGSFTARAQRHTFLRRVMALAGGAATAQVLTILSMPLLSRLYTPEEFGIFGIFLSVLGISACLATLQYENAIPLPRSPRSGSNLLAVAVTVLLGTTTIFLGVIFSAATTYFGVKAHKLQWLFWLLPPTFFVTGLYLALLGWALRMSDFRAVTQSRISQAAVVASTQICLGLGGITSIGLALGNMLGWAAGAALLSRAAWHSGRKVLPGISLAGMGRAAWRYRKFPLVSSFSAMLEMTQLQAPVLLVAALYGAEVGGLFLLANRVTLLPINMLALSVMQVMTNQATREARSPEIFARLLPRVLASLFAAGAVIAGLIAAVGPLVFDLVFGHKWAQAGLFVRALAPLLLAQFCVIPLNAILITRERQGLLAASHGMRVVLLFATIGWCAAVDSPPEQMTLAYSLTQAAAYFATLAAIWRVGRVGARPKLNRPGADI